MDDNLIVGHHGAIEDIIKQLKKNEFVVKVEDDLRDYLSCELRFNSDWTKEWLGQPHLLANLERKFGIDVHCMSGTKTPETPNFGIVHHINEDEKISSEKWKLYCSDVEMLLYLVKHSHPAIANAVREITKFLMELIMHLTRKCIKLSSMFGYKRFGIVNWTYSRNWTTMGIDLLQW